MNMHPLRTIAVCFFIGIICVSANAKPANANHFEINPDLAKFDPTGLHVKARIIYEPDAQIHTPRIEETGEVWYFPDAVVYLRSSDRGPYAITVYWSGDTAPDGDAPVQNWGTGGEPFLVPAEMMPLWYLHEISTSKNGTRVSIPGAKASMRSLMTLGQTKEVSSVPKTHFSWKCLVEDDRIISSTRSVVNESLSEKAGNVKRSEWQYVPPDISIKVIRFDDVQTTIPREVFTQFIPIHHMQARTMYLDSVEPIATGEKALLEKITDGMPRLYDRPTKRPYLFGDVQLRTLDGKKVSLRNLIKAKTAVLYLFDSAFLNYNPKHFSHAHEEYNGETLERLALFYKKYKNSDDVQILNIALDSDVDRIRAYVRKNHFGWPTLIVPPANRTKVAELLQLQNALPSVELISDRGQLRGGSSDAICLNTYKPNPNETVSPSEAESLINYARKARKLGSYAKLFLGQDVVRIMENCDTIFLYDLAPQNLEELYSFRPHPLPPPPVLPGMSPLVILYPPPSDASAETTDTINSGNWRSKIKDRLGNYAWKEKRQVPISRKGQVLRAFFDGRNMEDFGGGESYPIASYGIEFRQGKKSARLALNSSVMQEFKDPDFGATAIFLGEEGGKRLETLFKTLWSEAKPVRKAEDLGPDGPLQLEKK